MCQKQKALMIIKDEMFDQADNVYLTKDYIVKQKLSLCFGKNNSCMIISQDTYYKRNNQRDLAYADEIDITDVTRKRVHSTTYLRTYVD